MVITKLKLSAVGLAVAFSGTAFAQGAAVRAAKPVRIAPLEMPKAAKPVEVETRGTKATMPAAPTVPAAESSATAKLKFPTAVRTTTTPAPSAANANKNVVINLPIQTNTEDFKSCGIAELAQTVGNGTGISYDTTIKAVEYWSGKSKLNAIGTCQVALGGLGAFNAPARTNFIKTLDYGMQIQQQNPSVSDLEALGEGLSKAKNEYNTLKPTSVRVEMGTIMKLQKDCGIFRGIEGSSSTL